MGYQVEPARPEDLKACAAVLAEGFADDPVHSFIWPDAHRRHRVLPRYFELSLRYSHPLDGLHLVREESGRVTGVACWHPPTWSQTRIARMRAIPPLLTVLRSRVRAGLVIQHAIEQSYPAQPHWYLNTLATAAVVRGQGAGMLLLQERLEVCDRTGLDAYLVCTRESTIPYYQRVGFALTHPVRVPGGPTLWGMLRPARFTPRRGAAR
ncbi:GNAT family N-acetyltransferase [Nocardia transvalensis]|uniref:GNAT family N-acetyltransferase n=1 Tax=Nocardia transvalensis TaxID=37333 RepID=UPI0018962B9B|nr:GNAT family N-acetyltransferase [Nocardia transvalensis]MBF6331785.1 GNAT family N-acetyltransferase [Nocardia transvalensis]